MIGGPSELRSAFAAMAKAETQAVVVQAFLAGGLVSMAANLPELYERSALYVDKILKGTKPAGLPVEQPTKCQVAINMKTAKALGLAVPPTLLAQIDEVIEWQFA
jgi:putative ABC transport system substrate-binding protein